VAVRAVLLVDVEDSAAGAHPEVVVVSEAAVEAAVEDSVAALAGASAQEAVVHRGDVAVSRSFLMSVLGVWGANEASAMYFSKKAQWYTLYPCVSTVDRLCHRVEMHSTCEAW
jgi:hypothetical protein